MLSSLSSNGVQFDLNRVKDGNLIRLLFNDRNCKNARKPDSAAVKKHGYSVLEYSGSHLMRFANPQNGVLTLSEALGVQKSAGINGVKSYSGIISDFETLVQSGKIKSGIEEAKALCNRHLFVPIDLGIINAIAANVIEDSISDDKFDCKVTFKTATSYRESGVDSQMA